MTGGRDAVVIDTVRSPIGVGVAGGSLSSVHPVELLAKTLLGLLDRVDLDPAEVQGVITGCAGRIEEQSSTVGRTAWRAAGLPRHVPSTTVERGGGSSQQAVHFAAQGVLAGVYDVVIAAGIESMSHVTAGSSLLGRDADGPRMPLRCLPGLNSQVMAAELVALRWDIDREAMDIYAARSHHRAAAVTLAGEFRREIIPISTASAGSTTLVSTDETICPGITVDILKQLRPMSGNPASAGRYPDRACDVTAGNSSQIADAATAMLIMSEGRARQLGLVPRARFRSFAVSADDPVSVLPGPITATDLVLKKAELSIHQLDHVEVDETFAVVPLAWLAAVGLNPEFLNPRGGAIALGHPRGASGIRLMTTMLSALEDTGGRFGLQASWDAGGEADATIIERL